MAHVAPGVAGARVSGFARAAQWAGKAHAAAAHPISAAVPVAGRKHRDHFERVLILLPGTELGSVACRDKPHAGGLGRN